MVGLDVMDRPACNDCVPWLTLEDIGESFEKSKASDIISLRRIVGGSNEEYLNQWKDRIEAFESQKAIGAKARELQWELRHNTDHNYDPIGAKYDDWAERRK